MGQFIQIILTLRTCHERSVRSYPVGLLICFTDEIWCWKMVFFPLLAFLSHDHGNGNKLSVLEPKLLCGATCAVEPALQNTAQRSVIPLGHASKQDVDLLMRFYAEGVWQGCHWKNCCWTNCGSQHHGVCYVMDQCWHRHWQLQTCKNNNQKKPLNYCFP